MDIIPCIGLINQAGKPEHPLEGILFDSLDHFVLDLVPGDRVDSTGRAVIDRNDLDLVTAAGLVVVGVAAQPAGYDAHLKES
jgi:hypothetical protein